MRTPDSQSQIDSNSHPGSKIVFSLSDDVVWVSWPGKEAVIELGKYDAVAAMMRDFLDQSAIGERLLERLVRDQ